MHGNTDTGESPPSPILAGIHDVDGVCSNGLEMDPGIISQNAIAEEETLNQITGNSEEQELKSTSLN